jgi:hypothetical protein
MNQHTSEHLMIGSALIILALLIYVIISSCREHMTVPPHDPTKEMNKKRK